MWTINHRNTSARPYCVEKQTIGHVRHKQRIFGVGIPSRRGTIGAWSSPAGLRTALAASPDWVCRPHSPRQNPWSCQMHVQAHPGISAEIESCAQFPAISHCQLSVLFSSSRSPPCLSHNLPFSRVTYFDDTRRRHRQTSLPSAGLAFLRRAPVFASSA